MGWLVRLAVNAAEMTSAKKKKPSSGSRVAQDDPALAPELMN